MDVTVMDVTIVTAANAIVMDAIADCTNSLTSSK
jgi:hypothetical protein